MTCYNKFNILTTSDDSDIESDQITIENKNNIHETNENITDKIDKCESNECKILNNIEEKQFKFSNTYKQPFYYKKKSYNNHNNKNIKKVLCQNMIKTGVCDYGDKCLYAHTLEEQNMDDHRKEIYNILISNDDISDINLRNDQYLYKSLLEMTRICEKCIKNECKGGYNCKFGACREKYQICFKDLNYGSCDDACKKIHLTKRGLKPYYVNEEKQNKDSYLNGILLTASCFEDSKNAIDILQENQIFKNKDIDSDDDLNEILFDFDENELLDDVDDCCLSIFD